jgi:diguanylate cyclase (GGDEF)-like protein
LREQTRNMAIIAAQMVDGDLHNKIRSPDQKGGLDYSRAIEPLVRFHNALPGLSYVYTIIVENRRTYFILDTAADLRLRSKRQLQPSYVMEELTEDPKGDLEWLNKIRKRNSYVTPDFEKDEYGTFLSGHASFFDSENQLAGYVGIDVDVEFFRISQAKLRSSTLISLCIGAILAIGMGVLIYTLYNQVARKAAEIEQLTLIDALTGAWNRRGFIQRSKDAFHRFQRHMHPLSLLVIDIDQFKQVNDTYGHATGDEVLKLLVAKAKQMFRETDTFARIGGDEFISVLADTDTEGAKLMADRLRHALDGLTVPAGDNQTTNFTVSIGISSCRRDDDSIDSCVQRADEALYEAKKSGGNREQVKSC